MHNHQQLTDCYGLAAHIIIIISSSSSSGSVY
jgi:hypothetical protein